MISLCEPVDSCRIKTTVCKQVAVLLESPNISGWAIKKITYLIVQCISTIFYLPKYMYIN